MNNKKLKQKDINDLRDVMREKLNEICESSDEETENDNKIKETFKSDKKQILTNEKQVTNIIAKKKIGYLDKYT